MMPSISKLLATLLAALFVHSAVLPAQQPEKKLQILVLGGEGSINNVKQRTAREPVVEVQDENNRPVAGAIVFFRAPGFGASGTFPDGSASLRVVTDQQGRAVGRGFRPNQAEGNLEMQVTASYQGLNAATVIHMRNVVGAAAGGLSAAAKIILVVAGVGGAAAVGAALGTRGGGSATLNPTPATTITTGSGSVGPRP